MVFKVSVIIPTYNREDYLKKTIDSVINQTIGFDNIELILVDDNSTDDTQLIIEEYAKKYSNIKTKYLTENSGYPGKPRNIGLKLVTSDYIIFLDSDDYLEKDACEILYERINNEKVDLVFGTYTVYKNGRIIDGTPEYFKNKGDLKFNTENDEFLKVIELISPQLPINIFSKDIIDKNKIRFLEGISAQDAPFIIEYYFNSKNIAYLTDFNVYNYIIHDGSITTTRNIEYFMGLFKVENCIINIFKNNNREEDYKYYLKRRVNFFITQLLSSDIENKKDLNEVFDLFKDFFEKIACFNIVPQDDLNQLAFYSIKNKDIDKFFYLKNIYSKITRLWNHNEVLKIKNTKIKGKNKKLVEKVKKNKELREKYWKLREKYDNNKKRNKRNKKRIAELQTTKGWLNYKKSNIIDRIKNS